MAASARSLLALIEKEVLRCRAIAFRHFRSASLRVELKSDRSPVTIADRAIEERLRRVIERACPGERVVGEEFGSSGRDSTSYWTIDPIDGTRAFSRGLPSWGILVGRVERGLPTVGICDFPVIDVTVGVAPGVSAYERIGPRRKPLGPPRAVRSLGEAVIFHGGRRWWLKSRFAGGFDRLVSSCFLERAYGDCYGYLWALRGHVDAVVDYGVKVWDVAPLAALARATGRVLTDFSGRASFTGPEAVLAHPALARLIVNTLTRTQSGH